MTPEEIQDSLEFAIGQLKVAKEMLKNPKILPGGQMPISPAAVERICDQVAGFFKFVDGQYYHGTDRE